MEGSKKTKTPASNKRTGNSTKKTPSKISIEDGGEKLVAEIGLYTHVDLLNYWGKWIPQYVVVDKFLNDWVVCEHWYSANSHNEQFSQLGKPLIVKPDRLRVSSEKTNRPLPWDWYKSMDEFVRFCKSRVGGIGEYRQLTDCEKAAYFG